MFGEKRSENRLYKTLANLCGLNELADDLTLKGHFDRMLTMDLKQTALVERVFSSYLAGVICCQETESSDLRVRQEVWRGYFEELWISAGGNLQGSLQEKQLYLATAYMATCYELHEQVGELFLFVNKRKGADSILKNMIGIAREIVFQASSRSLHVRDVPTQVCIAQSLFELGDKIGIEKLETETMLGALGVDCISMIQQPLEKRAYKLFFFYPLSFASNFSSQWML